MNDNKKMVKLIGVACTVIGFGITMIQKQLDDKKFEEAIKEEVSRQLEQSKNEEI